MSELDGFILDPPPPLIYCEDKISTNYYEMVNALLESLTQLLHLEAPGEDDETAVRRETIKGLIAELSVCVPSLEDDSGEESCAVNSDSECMSVSSEDEALFEQSTGRNEEAPTAGSTWAPTLAFRDKQLWRGFINDLSASEMKDASINDDSSSDSSFEYSTESSASDSDSDNESDDNEFHGIATFPYLNSDSESEKNSEYDELLQRNPVSTRPDDIEVIHVDDDDDIVTNLNAVDMICIRCPAGKKFTDKNFFLVHIQRHLGNSHFACRTCEKPFTQFSFCLAHEVRAHGAVFDFHHPRIIEANNYLKRKEELKKKKKQLSELEQDVNCDEFEDELETETDEEDPKFYPGYAVPSTTLYPYRGPHLDAMCESYEVQLKYGRKKKSGVNTIAHVVLAHRQTLKEQGRIPDEGNNFWKSSAMSNVPITQREANFSKNKPSRKRPRCMLTPEPMSSAKPKRRKKKASLAKKNILHGTFVSAIISRKCLLCNYMWKTQEDLKAHRDRKHAGKTVLELMVVPKNKVQEDSDDDDLFSKVVVKSKPSLESFLANLGLISVKKLALRQRSNVPKMRPCFLNLERLPDLCVRRNGRVYICSQCDYMTKRKDVMDRHKPCSRDKVNDKSKVRIGKGGVIGKAGKSRKEIVQERASDSGEDYDDSADLDWELPKKKL